MNTSVLRLSFCVAPLFLTALPAFAVEQITPAAAYAYSTFSGRGAAKTIDGSGLVNGLHDASAGNMWMANGGNGKDGWFLVDFGSEQSLGSLKIWNGNQSGYASRGVKDVVIFVSTETDPRVNDAPDFTDDATWTEVWNLQVPQATGAAGYAGEAPLKLSVPVQARWVGFRIDEGWGGGYASISELQFFTGAPYIPTVTGIANPTATSVDIAGSLYSADGTAGAVTALYGTSDGGAAAADWPMSASLGSVSPGAFSTTLSGLFPDTGYYVALATGSGTDEFVTEPALSFMTGAITVAPPASFYENDTLPKSVTLTRPAGCASVETTVAYTVSGDAAADYASLFTGSATFPVGATSAAITFTPVDDSATTGDRSMTITVSSGDTYLTGAASSATFLVLDDESATASTYTWTGSGDGESWANSGNWTPTGIPMVLDTAKIDGNCSEAAPVVAADDISVTQLLLASTANSVGALDVTGGVCGNSIIEVGGRGQGFLTVAGGTVSVPNGSLYLGRNAGAEGTVVFNDCAVSVKSGKYIYVGDSGSGKLTVNGATSIDIPGASSGHLYVGNVAGANGEIVFNNGTISHGGTANIGNNGFGRVVFNGGTWSGNRAIQVGVGKTGVGEFIANGGHVGIGSGEFIAGVSGTGTAVFNAGSHNGRGVTIANAAGSTGTITIHEGASLDSGTTGYAIRVGKGGDGTLNIRGGTAKYSKNGHLIVREAAAASGLIDGWGTISCSATGGQIVNNGVVRANGYGEERALVLTSPFATFGNTIENDATNGWYAVDKGVLRLSNGATVAVGATGVYTWGEDENDAELDLVNSARIGFANVTAKVSSLEGRLYAPDHGDVPAFSAGQKVLGVWKFSANGAFDSYDLTLRYDHVAAKRLALTLRRWNGSAWDAVDGVTWDSANYLAKATGLTPDSSTALGTFAIVGAAPSTCVLIR